MFLLGTCVYWTILTEILSTQTMSTHPSLSDQKDMADFKQFKTLVSKKKIFFGKAFDGVWHILLAWMFQEEHLEGEKEML